MTTEHFPSADAIRAAVRSNEFNSARAAVLAAAMQGRATYLPAGARDNATARVLVDGDEVGQASVLMHYVREDANDTTYGERKLIPGYAHQIPRTLGGTA